MAGHNLHVPCLLDADIGIEALVGHGSLDDLTGKLQLHLDRGLVQSIKLRCLGFHDFVPAQGQGLGDRHAVPVRFDSIYQLPGPVIVDLKNGVGNGRPGGPAIHAVVIRRSLGDLNLSGNGRVFPFHLGGFPGLDIDGFLLGIRDIALVLQLPQIIAARLQILDIDIAPIVRGVLAYGGVAAVVEQEAHPVDAFSCAFVCLMDEDT